MIADDRKTILIVEDDAIIAASTAKTIERYGYKTLISYSGEDAVDVSLSNKDIDLILMDIDLGSGIDGTEAAERILKERDIPVVFHSSHTEPDIVEKTERITSYGYVVKNSGKTVLDASIKMAFKLFEANRQLSVSNESLRHHSQLLENIIENFPGFVLWKDPDSVFLGCNTNFAEKMGLSSPDDIIGKCDYDLPFLHDEVKTFLEDDRMVMQTGTAKMHFEEREHIAEGREIYLDTSKFPLFESDGQISGILAVAMDITESKRVEMSLNERVKELSCISAVRLEMQKSLSLDDFCGRIIQHLIPAMQFPQITYPVIELFGKKFAPDEKFSETANYIRALINTGNEIPGVLTVYYTEDQAFLIPEEQNLINIIADSISVFAAHRRMEEESRTTESRLGRLINILQHSADSNQEFLDFALDQAIQLTGSSIGYIYFYNEESRQLVLNTWSKDVMPQCKVVNPQTCYELDKTGIWGEAVRQRRPIILNDYQAHHPLKKGYPEGHVKLTKFITIPIFRDKKIVSVVGLANKETDYSETDILQVSLLMEAVWKVTERKKAEDRIKDLLAEKEIILKEVHHRIKNNMGTMISLLSLQAGAVKEPAASEVLNDAVNRMRSMGILYEKLYRSENLREMPVDRYLSDLADEIVSIFPNAGSVKIQKKFDNFILSVRTLSPLGMIVNELITNAMKYAFIGRENGELQISASLKGRRVVIAVADNGTGIPDTVDFEHSTGFGLQLAGMLTKQLGGNIRIERGSGTRIILEFDQQ